MTCIKHTYKTVSNAYKNGTPSPHSFEGVEWKEEKVCDCGVTLSINKALGKIT